MNDYANEKNKILEFVSEHQRTYLYGAGNIARAFLDVLENESIRIDGLIISQKNLDDQAVLRTKASEYKIYSAREAISFLQDNDAVIVAYTGARLEDVKTNLYPIMPSVKEFDILSILSLDDDIRFRPIVEKYNSIFGNADKEFNLADMRRILVVRLDMIGDMVFTTPFIRELRRKFKNSKITLVVRRQNEKIVGNCPYIDNLLLYDSPFQEGDLSRQCENIEDIEERVRSFASTYFLNKQYDVVFYPRELLSGRNVIDEFLIGIYSGAKIRIGRQIELNNVYGTHLRGLVRNTYSYISVHSEALHEAEYTLKMLEDLGIEISNKKMELWVDKDSLFSAKKLLAGFDDKQIIALGLVASVQSRTWSSGHYVELINMLEEEYPNRFLFVLFGGIDARSAADDVIRGVVHANNITDICGKTNISESIACMSSCNCYVGSNTGLLHFASALGIPSVTIYAELSDGKPTDGDAPERMGAFLVPHVNLVPPAGLDGCHGVCRVRHSHCIDQIKSEQVAKAILQLL